MNKHKIELDKDTLASLVGILSALGTSIVIGCLFIAIAIAVVGFSI